MHIYLIQKQSDLFDDNKEIKELFKGEGKVVIPVYEHDVRVDIENVKKTCPFFSLESTLPNSITSEAIYVAEVEKNKVAIQSVIQDKKTKYVIWTFPFHIDYMGAYILMLHELKKRGIKLLLLCEIQQEYKELFMAFKDNILFLQGAHQIPEVILN